jgi:hypothetical protein
MHCGWLQPGGECRLFVIATNFSSRKMDGDASIAMTSPDFPTTDEAKSEMYPMFAPTSTTVSPGFRMLSIAAEISGSLTPTGAAVLARKQVAW